MIPCRFSSLHDRENGKRCSLKSERLALIEITRSERLIQRTGGFDERSHLSDELGCRDEIRTFPTSRLPVNP
jgi:hypothetical protein